MSDMVLDSFEWECMVCGRKRPNARISVAHRPIPGFEALFPGTRTNVRYCNDRLACKRWATAVGAWTGPPDPRP